MATAGYDNMLVSKYNREQMQKRIKELEDEAWKKFKESKHDGEDLTRTSSGTMIGGLDD